MKTTKTNAKAKAAGQKTSGYIVTNGTIDYGPINDRSNANKKAKRLNAAIEKEGKILEELYEVKKAGSSAPTVTELQKSVDVASATIAKGSKATASKADKSAAAMVAEIVRNGDVVALVRKGGGRTYATRYAKPGGIEKLIARAKVYGVEVANAASAAKLVS